MADLASYYGVVKPSYKNCHLGKKLFVFGFLSVPTTATNSDHFGSGATAHGKLRILLFSYCKTSTENHLFTSAALSLVLGDSRYIHS